MEELAAGFRLLMDPASGLITFDSLRRNAPLLGLGAMSDDDLRGMLAEGDFDGDSALPDGVLRPHGQAQPRPHGPAPQVARRRRRPGLAIPLHHLDSTAPIGSSLLLLLLLLLSLVHRVGQDSRKRTALSIGSTIPVMCTLPLSDCFRTGISLS
ncbi:hypothetical protein ZWY2020_010570 [Hordeum vulgare]|nr:hypothetical protein ZWY2020_010570 [Hordeum vulgare]